VPPSQQIATPPALDRPSQIQQTDKFSEIDLFEMTENFRRMLRQKLDDKNFKSLPYKQDEINKIVSNLKSVFNMFHLLEEHSHDFSPTNLAHFVNRLNFLLTANDDSVTATFKMPAPIKALLTKLLLKHVPHMLPLECYHVFQRVQPLQFQLDDPFTRALMQLLKYHVNELSVEQLVKAKINLSILKKAKAEGTKAVVSDQRNESKALTVRKKSKISGSGDQIVDSLDTALDLAAELKYQDVKDPREVVKFLRHFGNSVSEANFTQIMNFMSSRDGFKGLGLPQSLELVKAMAKRDFKHLKLLRKIKMQIIEFRVNWIHDFRPFKSLVPSDSGSTVANEELFCAVLCEFQTLFCKLKFRDEPLLDFMVDKQLAHAKKLVEENRSGDGKLNGLLGTMLESLVFFERKREDVRQFLVQSKLEKSGQDFPHELFEKYMSLFQEI
jgi:hypothetical protein